MCGKEQRSIRFHALSHRLEHPQARPVAPVRVINTGGGRNKLDVQGVKFRYRAANCRSTLLSFVDEYHYGYIR
jgi:hypothetical protein